MQPKCVLKPFYQYSQYLRSRRLHPIRTAIGRSSEKERDRSDSADQANLLEFSEVALNVQQSLIRIHLVPTRNPIRQFLRCLATLKQTPEASSHRIEGVNRIEVSHSAANRNDDHLAGNFARNDRSVANVADLGGVCRQGKGPALRAR